MYLVFSCIQTIEMSGLKLLFYCYFLLLTSVECSLDRNKRFLIFPRQAPTRHQFIGGIGIPADLPYESLTVGHVLKAQFYLPYNATIFRENPFLPEYKVNRKLINTRSTKVDSSSLRYDIYAYIINRLESYGYNGQECLQKAICEANAINFERHYDVFAELMHIFLDPFSSADMETADNTNFKQAAKIGNGSGQCEIYSCNISLINWISHVLKIEI